jgi:hypothetical protein
MQKHHLALSESTHEPGIQRNSVFIGCPCPTDEGRRIASRSFIAHLHDIATRLSFRISRYGVTRTSLGITRDRSR